MFFLTGFNVTEREVKEAAQIAEIDIQTPLDYIPVDLRYIFEENFLTQQHLEY